MTRRASARSARPLSAGQRQAVRRLIRLLTDEQHAEEMLTRAGEAAEAQALRRLFAEEER